MVGALAERCKLRRLGRTPCWREFPWLGAIVLLLLVSCGRQSYQAVSGATMGTYYRVQADCPVQLQASHIDEILVEFNQVFSTYDPNSELSQLNLAALSQWRPVSPQLMNVLLAARSLGEQSDGAFDPGIGALVNLWGFGPAAGERLPDAQALVAAGIGFAAMELDPGIPAIRASQPVELDLSAVAKGRAVDQLIETLQALTCDAALVDIGGEIRVFGVAAAGRPWRLAIEQPGELVAGSEALPVLELSEGAVATSGDYRNFRELDGRRVSHLIDPRTRRPITHGLASVTVWHPETMWADGYATAINVLGPESGQRLANEAKLAVAMLIRTPDGAFQPWMSDAFRDRFAPASP